MKTSKIIFSIAIIVGVLFSTATMAQTRVIFTTRIVAPAPHHYHPQPPICGGYCAPVPRYNHYRPSCGHQQAYNNNNSCSNNNYRNGNRQGYGNRNANGNRNGNRNGNGRGNHPRHY